MAEKKKQKNKKNKQIVFLLAYLGLILLCALVVYVVPSVRGMLVKTYIAEQGELELKDNVDAYVVRDETVYLAANAGKVNRLAEKGKLVKAYTTVVEISGEGIAEEDKDKTYDKALAELGKAGVASESGATEIAGYVSYNIDGAEGKLRTEIADDIKQEKLTRLSRSKCIETAKGKCAKGDPVFKIVKNGKWNLIFYVEKKAGKRYAEGNSVRLRLGDQEYKAIIKTVKPSKKSGKTKVVLSCGFVYKGFLTDRNIDAEVITASAKGLKLEDQSIVEKDGVQGVLVKNKLGQYVFKRVCVKADDGENCVVYQDIFMDEESNFVETINIYDEIVQTPSEKDVAEAL